MKRTRLKRRSPEGAKEERQYLKRVKVWKTEHPLCEACEIINPFRSIYARAGSPFPTEDCHHKAGKEHGLLLKEEFWCAICRPCHNWVGDHGKLAFELGLRVRLPTNLDLPGMDPTPRVFH